jgi:hypothetical protein
MEVTVSTEPIPVAERSMPRVCGRSFAENEGSNPAWISISCESCVFSGTALCDEPIPRSEESYRLWCDIECGLETSTMRWSWPALGCCAREEKKKYLQVFFTTTTCYYCGWKIDPAQHYGAWLSELQIRLSATVRFLFWVFGYYNSPSLRLLSDQSFTISHKTVLRNQ